VKSSAALFLEAVVQVGNYVRESGAAALRRAGGGCENGYTGQR